MLRHTSIYEEYLTPFNITMPDAEPTQIINIANVEKKMKK
jgi:hypothetical protein